MSASNQPKKICNVYYCVGHYNPITKEKYWAEECRASFEVPVMYDEDEFIKFNKRKLEQYQPAINNKNYDKVVGRGYIYRIESEENFKNMLHHQVKK